MRDIIGTLAPATPGETPLISRGRGTRKWHSPALAGAGALVDPCYQAGMDRGFGPSERPRTPFSPPWPWSRQDIARIWTMAGARDYVISCNCRNINTLFYMIRVIHASEHKYFVFLCFLRSPRPQQATRARVVYWTLPIASLAPTSVWTLIPGSSGKIIPSQSLLSRSPLFSS